jgi:hypothetical protein
MIKRSLLAVLAIFVAWSAMDFLLHGVFLTSSYAATAALWRPMPEMKMGLISFTILVSAFVFVYIYYRFFAEKTLGAAVKWVSFLAYLPAFPWALAPTPSCPCPKRCRWRGFLARSPRALLAACCSG